MLSTHQLLQEQNIFKYFKGTHFYTDPWASPKSSLQNDISNFLINNNAFQHILKDYFSHCDYMMSCFKKRSISDQKITVVSTFSEDSWLGLGEADWQKNGP